MINAITAGLLLTFTPQIGWGQPASQKPTTLTWNEFKAKENGFSIAFPVTPEHSRQTIEIPKTDLKIYYDTYLSEPSDSAVYVVSVWNYPTQIDMSHPEVNLQDGFSGMISALPGSQVLSSQVGEQQGFQSLEFLVKNEDIFFQGKLVLVYNTLYQVFVVYKETENMTNNYMRFMNSFRILDPEKRKAPATQSKMGTGVRF